MSFLNEPLYPDHTFFSTEQDDQSDLFASLSMLFNCANLYVRVTYIIIQIHEVGFINLRIKKMSRYENDSHTYSINRFVLDEVVIPLWSVSTYSIKESIV